MAYQEEFIQSIADVEWLRRQRTTIDTAKALVFGGILVNAIENIEDKLISESFDELRIVHRPSFEDLIDKVEHSLIKYAKQ